MKLEATNFQKPNKTVKVNKHEYLNYFNWNWKDRGFAQ